MDDIVDDMERWWITGIGTVWGVWKTEMLEKEILMVHAKPDDFKLQTGFVECLVPSRIRSRAAKVQGLPSLCPKKTLVKSDNLLFSDNLKMSSHSLVFGTIDWKGFNANQSQIRANHPEENDDLVKMEIGNLFYSYNRITNRGHCSNGFPINIDASYSLEKKFAERINHPNYLGLMFINHAAKQIVHREYEQTFNEYVKGISVYEYSLLQVKNCSQLIYSWIVPEKLKHVISDLLQFVCDMHMKGKCLSDFNEENLVVTQTCCWYFNEDSQKMVQKKSVMFWKVGFVDFTLEGRRKDMKFLHNIIGNLFKPGSKPLDVMHFLEMLTTDVNENQWKSMAFYLKHHLAILTLKDRMLFMKSCNEKQYIITNKNVKCSYERALKAFHNKLDGAWRKKFEDTALGAMKKCFQYKPKEADGRHYTPYADGTWLDAVILRCIRNMATHLPRHIASFKDYIMGTQFDDDDFTMDVELDACMMYLFRKELLMFQLELYHHNVLEEIHR